MSTLSLQHTWHRHFSFLFSIACFFDFAKIYCSHFHCNKSGTDILLLPTFLVAFPRFITTILAQTLFIFQCIFYFAGIYFPPLITTKLAQTFLFSIACFFACAGTSFFIFLKSPCFFLCAWVRHICNGGNRTCWLELSRLSTASKLVGRHWEVGGWPASHNLHRAGRLLRSASFVMVKKRIWPTKMWCFTAYWHGEMTFLRHCKLTVQ